MSSILIKGMEMPKDRGVYIAIDIDGQAYTKPVGALGWKNLKQKAVLVPPHGDLIDRAMLTDSFEPSDFWNSSAEDNCFAAIRITNSMPAIIPAEEKS